MHSKAVWLLVLVVGWEVAADGPAQAGLGNEPPAPVADALAAHTLRFLAHPAARSIAQKLAHVGARAGGRAGSGAGGVEVPLLGELPDISVETMHVGDYTGFVTDGGMNYTEAVKYHAVATNGTVDRLALGGQGGLLLIVLGSFVTVPAGDRLRCKPINQGTPLCVLPQKVTRASSRWCAKFCAPDLDGNPPDTCPPNCCKCSDGTGWIRKKVQQLFGLLLMFAGAFVQWVSGVAPWASIFFCFLSLAVVSNVRMAWVCDYDGFLLGQGCF